MGADEIARIEEEGIEKTKIEDWQSARTLFLQALAIDMPALRQAEILSNVAGTYLKEGNSDLAYSTAEKAVSILNSEGISAPHLRSRFYNIMVMTKGELTIGRWPRPLVFVGGAYLGFSIASYDASGAPKELLPFLSHYGPALFTAPLWLVLIACLALRGWNQLTWRLALKLGRYFLYGLACSFLISNFLLAVIPKISGHGN